METAPGPTPESAYDLCVSNGDFRLKLAEVRLVLSDAGISYSLDGASGLRPWSHLVGVRIQALNGGPRSSWESAVELGFSRGKPLIVHSSGVFGRDERQRDRDFVAFAEDLHRRLSEDDIRRIAFRRGIPEGRHQVMIGFVAVAMAIFGGGGLFILAKVVDGTVPLKAAFFPLLAALGICGWFVHGVLKSRPGVYDPRQLPRDLYPE